MVAGGKLLDISVQDHVIVGQGRYLSFAEASLHPLCQTFFVVVHETGHRPASVRHLRWSDLDLEKKTIRWRAENDKIGFLHTTPLSRPALDAPGAPSESPGSNW
ncbi:MAG: hypothetical protein NVSMB53_15190 [Gemmatimonadaceae bacterium]